MKYKFHPEKNNYLNKRSRQLLQNILREPAASETNLFDELKSHNSRYSPHALVVDAGNLDAFKVFRRGYDNRYFEYNILCRDMKIIFTADGIKTIYDLIESIHKDTNIFQTISEDFSFSVFVDWVIENRYDPINPATEITQLLLNEFERASKQYVIYFPVEHLEMHGSINIGLCTIEKATKQDLEQRAKEVSWDNVEKFVHIQSIVRDKPCIKFEVVAERKKAMELAAVETSLSIDSLKILFASLVPVNKPIIFDVDFKNIYQTSKKVMIQAVADFNDYLVSDELAQEAVRITRECKLNCVRS